MLPFLVSCSTSADPKSKDFLVIDLSKAFYTIDHKIILDNLKCYGIKGAALNWFTSYLSQRFQHVQVSNHNRRTLRIYPEATPFYHLY